MSGHSCFQESFHQCTLRKYEHTFEEAKKLFTYFHPQCLVNCHLAVTSFLMQTHLCVTNFLSHLGKELQGGQVVTIFASACN